jgi:mannonate dehydratase
MLKIIDAKVIVTCPGPQLRHAEDHHLGRRHRRRRRHLNGREMAVVSYLRDHMIPCLIGRDAHQIEDIWQFFYRGSYWRGGPVGMSALAAVDMALWDIKAKVAGLPLYQLLGGACREGVTVYGHANGETIEDTIAEAVKYKAMGYKAIRLQTGVPGLASTYGVSGDKMFYEPADNLPSENVWSTAKYSSTCPSCSKPRARRWAGRAPAARRPSPPDPDRGGRLGKDLEPYRLFWLEDAVPAENQAGFRLIRQHTTTPLAVGEIFSHVWDANILIQEQLIDYLRATVLHAGGITNLKKIAAFADLHHVQDRLPRRHRPVAGDHGRGPALRHVDPQLRPAGIHAPHAGDRRGVPARLQLQGRHAAPGRASRAWASTSTKPWPSNIPTSAPTCR